jgi:CheY-like chemotaxis protein
MFSRRSSKLAAILILAVIYFIAGKLGLQLAFLQASAFEQGNQSLQQRQPGLGLGLAISKAIAQAHSGSLVAMSDGRDCGTTFLLTMSTVPAADGTTEPRLPNERAARRGVRILLVDDHQDTCAALEKLLIRRGHTVAVAQNVRAATEAAQRDQFDLVISDVGLPDGTGIELLTQLRALADVRGIAISGFGMQADVERSLKAGFSEYLVKPVNLERLDAAIERAMSAGMN